MLRNLLLGTGYVLLSVLGAALLGYGPDAVATLSGALLLLIGAAGLVLVGFPYWWARHRPDPEVATAPSGAPATFFRRSRCRMVLSLLVTGALTAWCGVTGYAVLQAGYGGWAAVFGGFALVLAAPVALAAAGRVSGGGLWLTAAGVEHRNGAVYWSVPWSDVRQLVAAEPIRLPLQPGARPRIERTARWMWNYELRRPEQQLGFHAADLAGGPALILGMIAYYLDEPACRDRLGTAASWAGGAP